MIVRYQTAYDDPLCGTDFKLAFAAAEDFHFYYEVLIGGTWETVAHDSCARREAKLRAIGRTGDKVVPCSQFAQ